MEFIDLYLFINPQSPRQPEAWDTLNGSMCPAPLISEDLRIVFCVVIIIDIIIVVISSSLIISAVNLHKLLHNPHNYIIQAMAVFDLLSTLADMAPYLVRLLPTGCWIHEQRIACLVQSHLSVLIRGLNLSFLTYLCVERFIQINFSKICRLKINNKVVVIVILICHTLLVGDSLVYVLIDQVWIPYGKHIKYVCYSFNIFTEVPRKIMMIHGMVCPVICLILCIEVGSVGCKLRSKMKRENVQKIKATTALVIVFIAFFLPTPIYFLTEFFYKPKAEFSTRTLGFTIVKLIRYLTPVTNGFVLALTRPIYKELFIIFLTNNPRYWLISLRRRDHVKRVQLGKLIEQKSMMYEDTNSESIEATQDIDTLHETDILPQKESAQRSATSSRCSNGSRGTPKTQDTVTSGVHQEKV